jgi:hypothetical protein
MVLDPGEVIEEVAEVAFCSECHQECETEECGHAYEPDTNAGGYYMGSDCCEADCFTTRFRNALTEEWQYPEASRVEWEPSEPSWTYGE